MAQRYCTNCGNDLGPDDVFCARCGKSTVETAAVSTPEANVDVPPAPTQQAGGTPNFAPATAAPRQRSMLGRVLIGCADLLGLAVLFVGCLALLPSSNSGGGGAKQGGSDGGSDSGGGGAGAASDPADAQGPSVGQYASGIDTFTRPNYNILAANPDEHVGKEVDVIGQLLDNPESSGDEVAFQMWADPNKVEYSTIVHADRSSLNLRTDNYVHVRGEVLGSMEGENAFGGEVSAVEVDAYEVERVEGVDAIDPTQETLEVGQTQSGERLSITLEKLDFGVKHARAHVTARNEGEKTAKLDLDRSKIVQGGDRLGQKDPYDYSVTKPKSGLLTGEQTEGTVIFGRPDPSEPFQVSFEWERGGYMAKNPDPIVFQVTP
ncbi:MAG: zinc ribbon domain-containing protein [Gemmatimonadota bacterium]|nr:zinc ribbon domain-containing protein [Gemmatimonadota bacterium]